MIQLREHNIINYETQSSLLSWYDNTKTGCYTITINFKRIDKSKTIVFLLKWSLTKQWPIYIYDQSQLLWNLLTSQTLTGPRDRVFIWLVHVVLICTLGAHISQGFDMYSVFISKRIEEKGSYRLILWLLMSPKASMCSQDWAQITFR